MSDLLYTVFTNIDPRFEEEFNDWQESEHVPYLLELPGYQSVIRYQDCDCKYRFANFWHISSMYDFENPLRLVKARTPWGMRLDPYRDRRIDFYVQDKGIDVAPPTAEIDPQLSILLVESYRDTDDKKCGITELYRQQIHSLKNIPHILDIKIYHAYENRGIEENCIFYYLSGFLEQIEKDTIPQIDSLIFPVKKSIFRSRYFCISQHISNIAEIENC
ncbi:hypothetical protein NBH08_23085 [Faecalicatena sp. BF-R-105]|nr:hypothetical protein [Faecalicatena sp. BF-R-105]